MQQFAAFRQVLVGRIVTMDRNGTIYPHGAMCVETNGEAAVETAFLYQP